ncbi:hypothetical protein WR164_10790 [Philodulcilactobacillus myokoensis]|uniref:UDP-N-acetylglucosamine kinase n=1 Tax=Philodulcilactobacillus myokoensis TaxID=2929573 RepID=A0A9W6B281_9LACO|nr:AAA family ATPase [Philodulcilactobacillus myokoensis]GLB47100.1 hypothetical protein WR164_10790 [Philodulcilactobacillus myokoensis]
MVKISTVILIRGNSGSGKTTVANQLHRILGSGTLLVSQDYIRRQMLMVKDKPNNLEIGLIETIIDYGIKHCRFIIIEGILPSQKYGKMLKQVLKQSKRIVSYYYDLSFDETLKRNHTKVAKNFSKEQMQSWFIPKNFLGIRGEKAINKNVTQRKMIQIILNDIKL